MSWPHKTLPEKDGRDVVLLPFFPGFYESMLSSAIDQAEEQDAEWYAEREWSKYESGHNQPEHLRISKDEYASIFFDCTDYGKTYLKVAQYWVEAFDEWCHDNIGTPEKSFTWESMVSPREYNFTTDRVFAYVPTGVLVGLFEKSAKEEHKTLAQVIKDNFTSYDGFSSFYSNDIEAWLEKPLAEWDHNELGTLVAASIVANEEFGSRADFSMAIYEILFSGNGEDDREVDWPKFEAKVAELRAEKQEAHEAELKGETR